MKTTARKSGKSSRSTGSKEWKKSNTAFKPSPIDVYERITNLIIEKLEQGIIPWHQPWNAKGMPSNYLTKRPYHGINLWVLLAYGHDLPYYLTFKQAESLGGKVKRERSRFLYAIGILFTSTRKLEGRFRQNWSRIIL